MTTGSNSPRTLSFDDAYTLYIYILMIIIYIGQQVTDDDMLRFDYSTHTPRYDGYHRSNDRRVIQYFRIIPYIDVIIRMDDLTSGLRSVSDTGIFLAR